MESDVTLMLRCKDGDDGAFVQLFKRHSPRLLGYVDRYFHNRALAEEIVQEVFLKLHRAKDRYEPSAKFTTWLYTIATRTCLNELRRHKVALSEFEEVEHADGAPRADEIVALHRLQHEVAAVLAQLPDKQRAAFNLVRFAGHSYDEAAEILDVSPSSLKALVFRATQAMRKGVSSHREPNVRAQKGA